MVFVRRCSLFLEIFSRFQIIFKGLNIFLKYQLILIYCETSYNKEIWDYRAKWLLFLESSDELILNDCKGSDDCRCSWVTGVFEKETDKLCFFSSFRINVRKKLLHIIIIIIIIIPCTRVWT